MRLRSGVWVCVLLALAPIVPACGARQLDRRPHVRGTVEALDASTLTIRHKNGQSYTFRVRPETRFMSGAQAVDVTAGCPGARAMVVSEPSDPRTAAEVRLTGRPCPPPRR